jgi:hypothetical protein
MPLFLHGFGLQGLIVVVVEEVAVVLVVVVGVVKSLFPTVSIRTQLSHSDASVVLSGVIVVVIVVVVVEVILVSQCSP